MPLSTLGNINQIGAAMMDVAGGPTPLDALEARRSSREAERVAAQEADAKMRVALESGRAGGATRAAEARTALILQQAPKITAQPGDAEFPQQIKDVYKYAINSGDAGAIEYATKFMSSIDSVAKTSAIDEGTLGGTTARSQITGREASAREADATAKYKDAQTSVLESFGSVKAATPNVTNNDIKSATDFLDDKPRQNWYSGDKGADAAQLAAVAKKFETQALVAGQYGYTPFAAQEDAFKHLTSGGTYLPAFMTGAPMAPAGSRNRNEAPANTGGQGTMDDPDGLFK